MCNISNAVEILAKLEQILKVNLEFSFKHKLTHTIEWSKENGLNWTSLYGQPVRAEIKRESVELLDFFLSLVPFVNERNNVIISFLLLNGVFESIEE